MKLGLLTPISKPQWKHITQNGTSHPNYKVQNIDSLVFSFSLIVCGL
jgi:hypothetical protein